MRVLQHIADNTGTVTDQIQQLENYDDAEVILFNMKDPNNYHRIAAVEVFLEKSLKPLIPSLRQG